MQVTRLAPSPTGAFHLGNARTFLINWLLARQNQHRIILRIDDLDGPRLKAGADRQAIEDLSWLGLDWDDGPFYQSSRLDEYRVQLQRLEVARASYPCVCSRAEVERAASAPHAEDGSPVYPGTCRDRFSSHEETRRLGGSAATRLKVEPLTIGFDDLFRGRVQMDPSTLGDFVIAKGDGTPAYQLANVVDDANMNVTHVVRGDDLLESTVRQIAIYQKLNWEDRIPRYCHLPLVVGTDGRRLAKRHGDTRVSFYRQSGVKPGRLLAWLGRTLGVADLGAQTDLPELLRKFRLKAVPAHPIVVGPAEEAALLNPSPS